MASAEDDPLDKEIKYEASVLAVPTFCIAVVEITVENRHITFEEHCGLEAR